MAALEREKIEAQIAKKIAEEISAVPGTEEKAEQTDLSREYEAKKAGKSWATMERQQDEFPFRPRELSSGEDVIEQYLKLKPLFETVFAKFDLDDNGVLDQQEFKRFEKALRSGTLNDMWNDFEKAIADAKDVYRKSMEESKVIWKNFPRDEDSNVVTWDNFWAFFSSEKRIEMVKKDGLLWTFLMFAACGSPSYQQLFANLKPNFVTAFNKYDVDKNGYIDQAEFAALAEDTIAGRPDMEEFLDELDENADGKITWGEFWKFFSTGRNFATDTNELERTLALLDAWGVNI